MFTEKEIEYLRSQPLGRLATVSDDGQPDAVPVGFEFDGSAFIIWGRKMTSTRKYKNIESGNPKVSLIVDDLKTIDPWNPRGLRVYGRAEIVERTGRRGVAKVLRIVPEVSWSWNVEKSAFSNGKFEVHKSVHVAG